jgi:hypothetical protein
MAYNTDLLVVQTSHGPSAPQVWTYGPTADAVATVRAAGYISNGGGSGGKGMRVGDIVCTIDSATPLVSWSRVSVVNATTGAVTLTA